MQIRGQDILKGKFTSGWLFVPESGHICPQLGGDVSDLHVEVVLQPFNSYFEEGLTGCSIFLGLLLAHLCIVKSENPISETVNPACAKPLIQRILADL
jgi:hypothetical protein